MTQTCGSSSNSKLSSAAVQLCNFKIWFVIGLSRRQVKDNQSLTTDESLSHFSAVILYFFCLQAGVFPLLFCSLIYPRSLCCEDERLSRPSVGDPQWWWNKSVFQFHTLGFFFFFGRENCCLPPLLTLAGGRLCVTSSEGLPLVDLFGSTPASCFLVVITETVSCALATPGDSLLHVKSSIVPTESIYVDINFSLMISSVSVVYKGMLYCLNG